MKRARRKTKIRDGTRLKNGKFAQSKDKGEKGGWEGEKDEANCTGRGLIIGANSKTRCSRHFNFLPTILQIKGRKGMRPLVIFFPFRYVMHSFVISCISAGKIFSSIFPPAEFFRCYSGGLHSVVFHSFYASFLRCYCESHALPTKGRAHAERSKTLIFRKRIL